MNRALLILVACCTFSWSSLAQTGQWEPLMKYGTSTPWSAVQAVHLIHLHTGDLLFWGNGDIPGGTHAVLWNPGSPTTFTSANAPSPYNLFCAGHSALANGEVLVAGGGFAGTEESLKAPFHTVTFDPTTSGWISRGNMVQRRWYPTCTTLGSGRVIVFGGWSQHTWAVRALIPEIYNPASTVWSGMQSSAEYWVGLYPFTFVMPDGRVFFAGPDSVTRFLDLATSQWVGSYSTGDPAQFSRHASAAMFDAVTGLIIRAGGCLLWANESEKTARVFDNHPTTPAWVQVADMNFHRVHHQLVCLPNGKVLAVGGAYYAGPLGEDYMGWSTEPVLVAETYDPQQNLWECDDLEEPTSYMTLPRMYHSTATLLRDGRVLVAGGENYNDPLVTSDSAQIYRPVYLFDNPERFVIVDAPEIMQYNQAYSVEVSHAAAGEVHNVSLTRLGSTTHGFDSDQRYVPLAFSVVSAGEISVTAPANVNIAPPGWYMLWVLDQDGVPCEEAAYVRLAP